ncbi:MAG: universal stress protein [Cyclobacteriaceae bacterium]
MSDLINKILVPTDFSKSANAAAKTAASLAKKLDAEVLVLHVTDVPGYGSFQLEEDYQSVNVEQIAAKIAEEKMEALQSEPYLQGIRHETSIQLGKVYKTILNVVKEQGVDMIVMGTHGLSGFDKFIMGSNTEKIVQLAEVPVLTIKDPIDISGIKNIVFASNFYDEVAISFPAIYQFIELFEAKLHLLKVITADSFEPSYYTKRLMGDFSKSFALKDYSINIINDRTIEEGIDQFCQDNRIDLITMTTHGRKGVAHFLSGSLTEEVGQKIATPVLSMKMTKVKIPTGVIFPD